MGCEGSTSKAKSKSIKNRKLPKTNPIRSSPNQPEGEDNLVRSHSPPPPSPTSSNSPLGQISKIFEKHTHQHYSALLPKEVFILNFDKQGHLECLEEITKVFKEENLPDMSAIMLFGLAPENFETVNEFLSWNFPKKVKVVMFQASKNTLSKSIS